VHKENRDTNTPAQALAKAAAVLIDFDGVIIDSEWPIYQSWRRVFEREGHELSQDVYIHCIGSDFNAWSPPDYLEELTGESFDWDEVNAARQAEIMRDLDGARPMPGAAELLQALEHMPSAIVSSSSHRWVDGWMEKLGLMPLVNTTVCRGDAPRIKPAPDLFLEAARQLDVDPTDCLVIEDSHNGMNAAHAAGMKVIAVPNRLTNILDFSNAEWFARSLTEVLTGN
jgi:HAD superfamily hydrolase (TIGR01509 family)